jgi:hypothetical protein
MVALAGQINAFLKTYGGSPYEWVDKDHAALVREWEGVAREAVSIGQTVLKDKPLRQGPAGEAWADSLLRDFEQIDRIVRGVKDGSFVTVMENTKRPGREPIPERVRHEVWRRDEGRCVDCGSRERLEFDHIVPFSKGGSNTARNLELRCESCNRTKGARI